MAIKNLKMGLDTAIQYYERALKSGLKNYGEDSIQLGLVWIDPWISHSIP